MGLWEQYKKLSDVLLKPSCIGYDPDYDLLQNEDVVHGASICREDFDILNDDGFNLKCHLFFPESLGDRKTNLVVFLHTRGGNALEGKFLLSALLPSVAVLLFNFAGSGISEGEYISLGMNETRDFKLVLQKAKETIGVNKVCLWGRSMGAVTSIMYTKFWNNNGKFFVTKEEYIEKNKKKYKKFMKQKEKEEKEKNEGAGNEDEGMLEGKDSQDFDMKKDLLESIDDFDPDKLGDQATDNSMTDKSARSIPNEGKSKRGLSVNNSKYKKSGISQEGIEIELQTILEDFGEELYCIA